ncbi:MAG TPA: CTP synthase, partial [Longimicrobiaceae bacterium]
VPVGLIGDHDPAVTAHRAIPRALELAAASLGCGVEPAWLPTESLEGDGAALDGFGGLWCVPASPYRSMEGALRGIRHARERGVPFLGTCGGFQHALIEYARNALGMADAGHAETHPGAGALVVAPLACSLVERTGRVRFAPGSRVREAYGADGAEEGYHCSFGLNPAYRAALEAGGLRFTGEDEAGDARAAELDGHPFFVGTLFQPERAALRGEVPPLVRAFVRAAATA